MSQFAPSVLLDTDPMLRQSIEAIGMPKPLAVRIPRKLIGSVVAGGLLATSAVGVYEIQSGGVAEAAFDDKVQANETVVLDFGTQNANSAINGTITSTRAEAPGYATVFPCNEGQPNASNLNYYPNTDIADAFMVKTDSAGKLCAYSYAKTDLIIDVSGIATPAVTSELGMRKPERKFDSRNRPPVEVVKPIFIGEIEDLLSGAICYGPKDGWLSAYMLDQTVFSRRMYVDYGDDGTVDLLWGVSPTNTSILQQKTTGDYFSFTVEGKLGKAIVDYTPCSVLPVGQQSP